MLLSAAVLFLPTIWIVDASNGPGTNFADLPAAVAAAANGDTLLVRAGVYHPFQVNGKALTIRGADPAVVIVQHDVGLGVQPTSIGGVPAGSLFSLSGMSFLPAATFTARGNTQTLRIFGGSLVALSHVVITGSDGPANESSLGAAVGLLIDSASVSARASTFRGGGQGVSGPGSGGSGIRMVFGTLVAVDCNMLGGTLQADDRIISSSGDGLEVWGGRASMYGCAVRAGSATAVGRSIRGGSGLVVQSFFNSNGTVNGFARVVGDARSVVAAGPVAGLAAPGFAIAVAAGSQVVVNGNVTLLVAAPGQPATSGPVTLGGPQLPRLDVQGAVASNGETDTNFAMTVAVDGLVPQAQIVLGFDLAPTYSTALAPLVVGEVFLPVSGFVYWTALDGAGHFAHTFLAGSSPAFAGVPVFGQVAVFDTANSRVLASNLDQRIYR